MLGVRKINKTHNTKLKSTIENCLEKMMINRNTFTKNILIHAQSIYFYTMIMDETIYNIALTENYN